jgi:hypothetical protein
MDNYIRIWDQVFDEDWCNSFINKAKDKPMLRLETNEESYSVLSLIPEEDLRPEVQLVGEAFSQAADKYAEACNVKEWQYPHHYGLEEIALFKYTNGTDETLPKIYNGGDSRRFLHFHLFLTGGAAGSIELPDHDVVIDRVPGRLVVFPCFFTYPYGIRESVGDSYIVHSFLRDASDLIEKK